MSIAEIQTRIQELDALIGGLAAKTASTDGTAFAAALDAAGTTTSGIDTTNLVASDGTTGDDVVAKAKEYLGVPYVFGGESKSGIDCSGLVQAVFKDLGIDVPRVVQDQVNVGAEVTSLADAQPGDLISLDNKSHIGIYLGDNKMLHAPKPGDQVKISTIWFDESRIDSIRRVVPSQADADAAAAAQAKQAASLSSISSLSSLSGLSGLGSSLSSGTGSAALSGSGALSALSSLMGGSSATSSSGTDMASYYRSLMLNSLSGRTA